MGVLLMIMMFHTITWVVLVVMLVLRYHDNRRLATAMKRVEKLLDLTEKHGAITERQQGQVARSVGAITEKAGEVVGETEKKAESFQMMVDRKINVLRTELDHRFKHIDEHIDQKFEEVKSLIRGS